MLSTNQDTTPSIPHEVAEAEADLVRVYAKLGAARILEMLTAGIQIAARFRRVRHRLDECATECRERGERVAELEKEVAQRDKLLDAAEIHRDLLAEMVQSGASSLKDDQRALLDRIVREIQEGGSDLLAEMRHEHHVVWAERDEARKQRDVAVEVAKQVLQKCKTKRTKR